MFPTNPLLANLSYKCEIIPQHNITQGFSYIMSYHKKMLKYYFDVFF